MELPINHPPFMNQSNPLLTLLDAKGPWVGDGPMGTELLRLGWSPPLHGSTHHWNCTHPELVQAVHQQWAAAGAQIHRTNTFALLSEFTQNPNRAAKNLGQAITLVRKVDPQAAVVAAFGPVSPNQGPPKEPLSGLLAETLSLADGILLETWSHPLVVDWARWLVGDRAQPLILSGCFRRFPQCNLATLGGLSPSDWVQLAKDARALAVGYNCGLKLKSEDVLILHAEMRKEWTGPLWCFPGPEFPKKGGLISHKATPLEKTIMGGCCGVDLATFRQRIPRAIFE